MQDFRRCTTSVIMALIVACHITGAFAIPLTPFRYETQAQRHCPADVVVWLDLRKGIYWPRLYRKFRVPGGSSRRRISPLTSWVAVTCPDRLNHEAWYPI
jgi:hypothetical protein